MTDYEQLRRVMVDNQLRTSNITDRRILAAMGEIPRELFVPEGRQALAYSDATHDLGGGRTLGAPAPFARLIQLAEIEPDDRVLDVGCGEGYSTAVLARLAKLVVAVDDDPALLAKARANLAGLGLDNAVFVEAQLGAGAPKQGPFDVIVLEGAVTAVAPALLAQLSDGGRLVALIRQGATAVANVFVRSGADVAARAEFNTTLPPLAVEKPVDQFVF